MSSSEAVMPHEAPLDTDELCARARFTLDEPMPLSQEEWADRKVTLERERNKIRANAVLVSKLTMPDLSRMVEEVAKRLLISRPPAVYVRFDPTPNASVMLREQEHEAVVVLHSALVDLLTIDELSTIIGHEYGHAAMRHLRRTPESAISEALILDRMRAQEVSADRIGLIAAGSVQTGVRAEFKLASGLSDRHMCFAFDEVVRDAEATMRALEREHDVPGATHPDFPFRIWAQAKFAQSDVFASLTGGSGGIPLAQIEVEIEEHFLAIGGGSVFRATADYVHEALAWIAVLIVVEDDEVTETEREALVQLVGTVWADDAVAYARRHGLDAVRRRALSTLNGLERAGSRTRKRLETSIRDFGRRTSATARTNEMLAMLKDALNG